MVGAKPSTAAACNKHAARRGRLRARELADLLDLTMLEIAWESLPSLKPRKFTHANALRFDNPELSRPVAARRKSRRQPRRDGLSARSWNSDQQNAARRRQFGVEGEFAEILVERQQNAVFGDCTCD